MVQGWCLRADPCGRSTQSLAAGHMLLRERARGPEVAPTRPGSREPLCLLSLPPPVFVETPPCVCAPACVCPHVCVSPRVCVPACVCAERNLLARPRTRIATWDPQSMSLRHSAVWCLLISLDCFGVSKRHLLSISSFFTSE